MIEFIFNLTLKISHITMHRRQLSNDSPDYIANRNTGSTYRGTSFSSGPSAAIPPSRTNRSRTPACTYLLSETFSAAHQPTFASFLSPKVLTIPNRKKSKGSLPNKFFCFFHNKLNLIS